MSSSLFVDLRNHAIAKIKNSQTRLYRHSSTSVVVATPDGRVLVHLTQVSDTTVWYNLDLFVEGDVRNERGLVTSVEAFDKRWDSLLSTARMN